MTVKVYKVETDPHHGENLLNVRDGGKPIDVSKDTTIVWYLDDDNGSFNAINNTDTSGFHWVRSPTADSGFGKPTVSPGGQVLTITDAPGEDGSFVYQLNATFDVNGTPTLFQTTYSSHPSHETTNNPTIKNT